MTPPIPSRLNVCPECGYDLSGHLAEAGEEAFRCPECGAETSRGELDDFLRERGDKLRTGVLWWMLAFVPAAVTEIYHAIFYDSIRGDWSDLIGVVILFVCVPYLFALSFYACSRLDSKPYRIVSIIVMFIALLMINLGLLILVPATSYA